MSRILNIGKKMKAYLVIEKPKDDLAVTYKVLSVFHRRKNAICYMLDLANELGLKSEDPINYQNDDKHITLVELEYKDENLH